MTLNAFRGKRDGRKWILDLMRDAARHLAPGGLLLSLQKIGKIFEHDHVSRALVLMAQGCHGDRHVERCALQRHLHLAGGHAHAVGAAQQRFQILQHFRRKYVRQARSAQHVLSVRIAFGVEHAQQGLVGVSNAAGGIERKHAGRNALEDGLHLAAALVEFSIGSTGIAAGSFDLPPAGFQFLRHAVEGADQVANFIGGAYVDAVVETPARDFLRRLGQRSQRTSHQLREKQRQPCGDKQHHHREQQKQAHIGLTHVFALAAELKITLLAGLDLLHRLRKLGRQRHGHQNQAILPHRGAAQRVLGLSPR